MPELRSGARRRVGGGRAQQQQALDLDRGLDPHPSPVTGVRTRATVAKAKVEAEAARNQDEGRRGGRRERGRVGRRNQAEEENKEEEKKEEEEKMAESGNGFSANRDAAQEEEGNTTPFPDKGGDFRYCHKCSHYKPSRAHHIRVCKRCVQRMGRFRAIAKVFILSSKGRMGMPLPFLKPWPKRRKSCLRNG